MSRTAGLVLPLAVLAGCSDQPRAPVLAQEAAYQYDPAGLRFLAPEGWVVFAKADPPAAGRQDKPIRLVAYMTPPADKRAELEVYLVDLADGQDVPAYLAAHPLGPDKWAAQPPEPVTVNGAAAARYPSASGKRRREVTAFVRDGGRAYLFVLTYPAAETSLRDQARRAVESVTWK